MNNILITLLIEEAPKDVRNLLYAACIGLISTVVFLFLRLDKNKTDHQKERLLDRDAFSQKEDLDKERYVNMLEKTLNAFTSMEKSMLENSLELPSKLIQSIEKVNAPLITEIKEVLKKLNA